MKADYCNIFVYQCNSHFKDGICIKSVIPEYSTLALFGYLGELI